MASINIINADEADSAFLIASKPLLGKKQRCYMMRLTDNSPPFFDSFGS